MTQKISVIGFDADDTLWHNERFFHLTQQRFADLLADYASREHLQESLLSAERRNLGRYGFGIKGFMLSMIETAIEVTEDRVPASVIREIIETGQEMLVHPIELMPHATDAVEAAALRGYRVMLITKGDLLDQERKLAQSGLGDMFDAVEIVSDKNRGVYEGLFDRHGDGAARALMVGNSMKSDVLPVIEAGGWGVFVPAELGWALEHAEPPQMQDRFRQITDLGQFSAILDEIA